MELANIAFHAETPGRLSVLGKYMRRIKLNEKVNNLFDENRGKRAMLRRYLSDAARFMDYTELDEIPNECDFDEFVDTLDCAFEEPNSATISILKQNESDSKYLDMGYSHDSKDYCESRNSSSGTLVCDDIAMDLVRESGDGTEVPDSTDNRNQSERVVVGAERYNLAEIQCSRRQTVSKRIIEGAEQPNATKFRRVVTENIVNTVPNRVVSDDTDVLQQKVAYCECNTLAATRKRLKHKTAGKLKGLLNLYKTMKLKKKLAKKCMRCNLTCITPVKSSVCLNSAFINVPRRTEAGISFAERNHLDITSARNDRLFPDTICELTENGPLDSETIGEYTENTRLDLAFMKNTSDTTCNMMDSAFVSSYLKNSRSNIENKETETLSTTQDGACNQCSDELNFAKLEIHSNYLSFCHDKVNCSSKYDDFAYFNNGFVMD